jgi:hypothetical protein
VGASFLLHHNFRHNLFYQYRIAGCNRRPANIFRKNKKILSLAPLQAAIGMVDASATPAAASDEVLIKVLLVVMLLI